MKGEKKPRTLEELEQGYAFIDRIIAPVLEASDKRIDAIVARLNAANEQYQPKTGQPCHCKPGQHRDNCPDCEGTGQRIDFAAIRARRVQP